ncbi:MAG TPA: hypothetical protein VOA19_15325 [Actinomycetes bacterium]|nr:hypothetical protein [Actinomycetes bacterium]
MAVRDQRARVLYRLPEQRRFGAGGMPTLLTMVLGAIVLFLGGLVVGRATMTRDPAVTGAPATTAAAATPPTPTAAATPDSTAATRADAAAGAGVGPRRVANGVGVGYAHSQQGAVAAAANYAKVLSSDLILDTAQRRAAIDTLAAPEARARQQKTFDQAVASLRAGLGVTGPAAGRAQVLLRATPVGWRVEQYGKGSARVAIWVTSVGGSLGGQAGTVPVREGWGTTTVSLRWVDGDWKQVASTTTDGPVPIADVAPPTAAGELVTKANEFKEFTYAPGP